MGPSPGSVAIGVPCFREVDRVALLAAALARLDPAPGALLAVDDGSGDGTKEALEAAGFDVVAHERNRGLGVARNTLWRRADSLGMQAIAFLDADVLPPADYLRRVCTNLASGRIAGVGGRNLDLSPQTWVDSWRGRFWPQDLGSAPSSDAPMLIGACATYRLSALRDVGGFNPAFRTNGEDVDIGRRLREQGQRLLYDPGLVVTHVRRDTPEDLLRMCYRHCREGMRATVQTPGGDGDPGPAALVAGMAKKAVRAPAAALVRRKDPKEAVLGAAACGAGLLGYAVGWARPRKRR